MSVAWIDCRQMSHRTRWQTRLTIGNPSGLRLVDISVVEAKDEYPLLDIKVLNVGVVPIFLYGVVVKVLRSFEFTEIRKRFRAKPVSWIYDLDLYPADHPYDAEMEVSQVVPANDGDRFQIRLGNEQPNFQVRETLYQIQVGLVSSDSHDLGFSEPIVLSVPMPKLVLGQRSYPDPEAEENRRRSVAEFLSLPGRKSGRIQELARKLSANERL